MDPMAEPRSSRSTRKLTYQDYCAIPEDGLRHEILDGEHVVTPAPLDVHQKISKNLAWLLESHLRATRAGELRFAPYDVMMGKHTVAQPDLLVILAENTDRIQRNGCHGAPDLAIEILSETTRSRDFLKKRRIYEKAGVAEYWLVDPDVERIEVYRREGSRLVKTTEGWAEEGSTLETPLLPGLRLHVPEVFR